jgi:hypothetical protein
MSMDTGAKVSSQAVLDEYVAGLMATCDFDRLLLIHEWTFAFGNYFHGKCKIDVLKVRIALVYMNNNNNEVLRQYSCAKE